jgi:rsbT antagonist protein RsbS
MNDLNQVTCIPLWDCLLVPLHGDISDAQADDFVTEVLERIARDQCYGVLVDLSGIWTLDSHLCAVLARLALAAQLMGAKTVLSGIKPEIAMTLEAMGIELHGIQTVGTLEDALVSMGITRNRQASVHHDELALRRAIIGDPDAS